MNNSRRLALLTLLILLGVAGIELLVEARGSGDLVLGFSSTRLGGLAIYGLVGGAAGLVISWELMRPGSARRWYQAAWLSRVQLPVALRWFVGASAVLIPTLTLLGPWGQPLSSSAFRVLLLLGSAGLASVSIPYPQTKALPRLILSMLVVASVFVIAKRLVLVTDYPFKLGWSEGNRLWDYSLYFRWDEYSFLGEAAYPTYLTPGRHGLWGIPFALPEAPISLVRLWDAALWIVPYLMLGWALVRRFGSGMKAIMKAASIAWIFLTLGGIFAPLVLSAVLVVWGTNSRKPARSMLVAGIAGVYAGLSRWTWLLAPATWTVLLILLDPQRKESQSGRIRQGLAVGLAGVIGGLASQWIMAEAFPRPDPVYSTSLSQPLLWYRMLPNPTFPIGIVPALALAIGPALALLAWAVRSRRVDWSRLEQGFVGLTIVVLIGAGLAASAKIGGGSNLHNADMLLVTILILVAVAAAWTLQGRRRVWTYLPELGRGLAVLALMIPALNAVRTGGPIVIPNQEATAGFLEAIQDETKTAAQSGPVLFIDQRQLFTFGQIEDVQLVMDYELKDMMNQALSANEVYFDEFRSDLENHRFAMIVSDPLPSSLQGRRHQFGEENDAWYMHVAAPLREYYRPTIILEQIGVWLLEPALESGE